ncbi:hypothetical protein EVAR_56329_1 [Eumeta japonica]|uniref:Uncharacterized protein n=1 Tax=Eumeta variegata TaxID=151549 RepID=A0A4C1YF41_EUMVA|nr:hypothetical protein EVAR_56329_1 [Eumeta japonica]
MPEWKGRVPLTRSHCERITHFRTVGVSGLIYPNTEAYPPTICLLSVRGIRTSSPPRWRYARRGQPTTFVGNAMTSTTDGLTYYPRIKDKLEGKRFESKEDDRPAYNFEISDVSKKEWSEVFFMWSKCMEKYIYTCLRHTDMQTHSNTHSKTHAHTHTQTHARTHAQLNTPTEVKCVVPNALRSMRYIYIDARAHASKSHSGEWFSSERMLPRKILCVRPEVFYEL